MRSPRRSASGSRRATRRSRARGWRRAACSRSPRPRAAGGTAAPSRSATEACEAKTASSRCCVLADPRRPEHEPAARLRRPPASATCRSRRERLAEARHARVARARARRARSRTARRRSATVSAQISSNDCACDDRVGEREQRLRALGLSPLLLVEPRVLERDRRLAGEHLEQADVVLVELVRCRASRSRSRRSRAPRSAAARRRATPRGPACRECAWRTRTRARSGRAATRRVSTAAPGDALSDLRGVRVGGRADVSVVFADERDRTEVVAVAQDDAAVVVVDQQPKLGRRSSRRSACTSFSRFSFPASDCSIFRCAIERTSRVAVDDGVRALRLGRRRRGRSGSCRGPSRSSSRPRRRRRARAGSSHAAAPARRRSTRSSRRPARTRPSRARSARRRGEAERVAAHRTTA